MSKITKLVSIMFVDWMVTFLLLCSFSHACDTNQKCPVDTNNENIRKLLDSMDYFATQLIQKLYTPNAEYMNPGVISPMSMYVELALMLFGSSGNTQKELYQALKFPDGNLEDFKQPFGDILMATNSKRSNTVDGKEDVSLDAHVAEGLFIHEDFIFTNEFADFLLALKIEVQPVDFLNKDEVSKAINSWVENNKPKSAATASSFSSSETTRIYLTNLFYFTAKWKDNLFLDIPPGIVPFYTLHNQIINLEMVKASTSLLHYDNGKSFSAVQIPYEGEDYVAIFFLPKEGVDPTNFVNTFTMDILQEFLTNAQTKDIDCQIPSFQYAYSFGLNQQLETLGIKELFGEADLTQMLNVQKQDLGVQMAQEIYISVDEKGSMADGLNVVPVQKNPPQSLTPFIADHPYLMLVRSVNSHAIAFAFFFY